MVNPRTFLRNWEQGRVLPDPAARSLLTIVARNPRAAFRALAATFPKPLENVDANGAHG
jgi:hypothetical protein